MANQFPKAPTIWCSISHTKSSCTNINNDSILQLAILITSTLTNYSRTEYRYSLYYYLHPPENTQVSNTPAVTIPELCQNHLSCKDCWRVFLAVLLCLFAVRSSSAQLLVVEACEAFFHDVEVQLPMVIEFTRMTCKASLLEIVYIIFLSPITVANKHLRHSWNQALCNCEAVLVPKATRYTATESK